MSATVLPTVPATAPAADRASNLAMALKLCDLGLAVIPAGPDKAPRTRWKTYQTERPSADQIRTWDAKLRPPVWGIVTGPISGRVVIDFDGAAGEASRVNCFGNFEPHVRTPSGGTHIHFEYPPFPVRTLNHKTSKAARWAQEFPGVDIRADGGFEALIGATDKGSYKIVRDLSTTYPWSALPVEFRRYFEPRKEKSKPTVEELIGRALSNAPVDGRNNSGFWLAVQLRDNGYSQSEAESGLLQYQGRTGPTNTKGDIEPYTATDARNSVAEAYKAPAREPWGKARQKPATEPQASSNALRYFPYTDSGNAERIVARNGQDIRYCHPQKNWYRWDGRRWDTDQHGHLMHIAKCIARSLYEEAAHITDDDRRKDCAAFARSCESTARKRAALISAQSEPGVPILPADFDTDLFLLNCMNGTIDLRTGERRPHRREDLITKLAPVQYDPAARSPLWERFLDETTAGNKGLQDFLQRAVGYSLTGDVSEEVLFFVHGAGRTGKSTFLEAIKATLGDYAKTADFETFVQRNHAGGVRDDIAELAGRRFVVSIEVDEGKKLAEGLTKLLTGGDTVRSRFLYQDSFDFQPQFKLWLAANSQPKIRHDDSAMWRRILRVPFEQEVPKGKRDPSLKARLKDVRESGPAIVAWAVEGCLRWREEGLGVPAMVEEATEQYRLDMDPLRDFLTDCCVLHPAAWITIGKLRKAYEDHCKERGEKRLLTPNEFAAGLRERGCESQKRHAGHGWLGIGLLAEESTMGIM